MIIIATRLATDQPSVGRQHRPLTAGLIIMMTIGIITMMTIGIITMMTRREGNEEDGGSVQRPLDGDAGEE